METGRGTTTSEKNHDALDALLHAVAPIELPEVNKLIKEAKQELISEIVKKINIFFMNKAEDATYYDFEDTLDYTYWSDIKKEYEEMLK